MARIVAVIGASSDRRKFGNKALRAFANQGYTVLAINPNEPEVEGYRTYGSVLDVAGAIDMATLYVQPDVGVKVIEEIARKGIPEVWLNPGADGEQVLRRAGELGVKTIQACSILGIGESPGEY
jgi:predicted CoA-binding protein